MSLGGILTGIGLIVVFFIVLFFVRKQRGRSQAKSAGKLSASSAISKPARRASGSAPKEEPDLEYEQEHEQDSAFLAKALDVLTDSPPVEGSRPMEGMEANQRMLHRALLTLKGMDRVGETFSKFQEFNDPFASLEQVANAVSKDVVLSSKVLRAANSAYFGYTEEVTSVQHAARILGFNNLRSLYFREHFRMLEPSEGNAASRRGLWKHAMLTAVAANHVSTAFSKAVPETAFTLGLLHDIGKFIICQMPMLEEGHKKIHQVMEWEKVVKASDDYQTSVDVERGELGIDHCLLGKMAMEDWQLPDLMADVVYHHHAGSYAASELDEEPLTYVAILQVADFIARAFAHRHVFGMPPGGGLEPEFLALTGKNRLAKAALDGSLLQDLLNTEAVANMNG